MRSIPEAGAEAGDGAWAHWLIARRRPEKPEERDYYLAWGPPGTSVEELVLVPGARWRVGDAIKLAKSAAGMAGYEVRSYRGWYRHVTLAQLAAAFLAVQDAEAIREAGPIASVRFGARKGDAAGPALPIEPVRFTACEIQRLVVLMVPQPPHPERLRHGLACSRWRRCHQAVARACHRRNRARAAARATARPPPPPKPRTAAAGPIYN